MKRYAKIINYETKQCEVGDGTNYEFYKSLGMTPQDVEQSWDEKWYLKGFTPEKPQEVKEQEVRATRNSYLETYVDPLQLVIRWGTLSETEQNYLIEYRQYLLDYTNGDSWWEQNPDDYETWLIAHHPVEE